MINCWFPGYLTKCLIEGFLSLNIHYRVINQHEHDDFNKFNDSLNLIDISQFQFKNPDYILTMKKTVSKLANVVFIGCMDESINIVLPDNILFTSHENRYINIPGNRIEWPFGVSQKMIEMAEKYNSGKF